MKTSYISAIGTANPDMYLTQAEAYAFYRANDLLPDSQIALYERLLLNGPIKGRHIGLDRTEQIIDESFDEQVARFTTQGRKILAQACREALSAADLKPSDIGGVVVNTCTGYICPGLTSYLAEDLGLPSDIKNIDIMGMGCGSAIPNLECACGLAARTRGRPVISAAVEVCSATHLIDDDPGLTVSNAIFGDGAAAAIVEEREEDSPGLRLLDFETGVFPQFREELRYRTQGSRLRNSLTRKVPIIGANCVAEVAGRILKRNGLEKGDVRWWAVHGGGTEVLRQVAKKMDIPIETLAASSAVFEHYGNMSSPTVLFTLRDLMEAGHTDGTGLVLAFGAGFTAFAALAEGC